MTFVLRLATTGLITLALACTLACGDDGGDSGEIDAAATIDAATADAGQPDAQTSTACNTLCTCASTYCSRDMTECMNECAGLPASVTACRITHCGYAQQPGGAATHCPHAAGDTSDPTTPSECRAPGADAGP